VQTRSRKEGKERKERREGERKGRNAPSALMMDGSMDTDENKTSS
jgi:hypothetical protein